MSDLLAHLFRQLTLLLDFIYTGEVNVLEDDLNAFLSVASDLKIEGLTSSSTSKQAKSGFSSTQVVSLPARQLTSTPIQASTSLPTSIDPNQLSSPSLSTPDLYNPKAGLDLIKKEPIDPSDKPCTTPQGRTVNPKSLVKKIPRDSDGKKRVECVVCGKRLLGGSADGERHVVNVHLNGEGWEANNRGIYYSHKKVKKSNIKEWDFSNTYVPDIHWYPHSNYIFNGSVFIDHTVGSATYWWCD